MEKEKARIKKAEQQFNQRQKLAENTGKTLLEKARKDANERINQKNKALEDERTLLIQQAKDAAADYGKAFQANEAIKRDQLQEKFDQNKEKALKTLITEVVHFGDR